MAFDPTKVFTVFLRCSFCIPTILVFMTLDTKAENEYDDLFYQSSPINNSSIIQIEEINIIINPKLNKSWVLSQPWVRPGALFEVFIAEFYSSSGNIKNVSLSS